MTYERITKLVLLVLLFAFCSSVYLGWRAFRALDKADEAMMMSELWRGSATNMINIHSQNINEIVKYLNSVATSTK